MTNDTKSTGVKVLYRPRVSTFTFYPKYYQMGIVVQLITVLTKKKGMAEVGLGLLGVLQPVERMERLRSFNN
jgi:hypothetical protein